ncbi:MAG: hypothetical protein J5849_07125 [Clostridia bacterium]|nr:hypothetical protein [Clostridia bacterium]
MLPETEGESAWEAEKVDTGYFRNDIAPDSETAFVTMRPDQNGYILYAQHGVYLSDRSSLCEIKLDWAFNKAGFRELGNARKTLRFLGTGRESGGLFALESFEEATGEVRFRITRDGEALFSIPGSFTAPLHVSVLETGDGVYASGESFLYFEGKRVKIPDMTWEETTGAFGFLHLDGRDYAVLKENVLQPDATAKWYLAELHGEKTGPLIETNIRGDFFFPGIDGQSTYYISGYTLWKTDGKTREKQTDLSSMGFAASSIRDVWQEKNRIMLLTDKGLFLLTEEADGNTEDRLVLSAISMSGNLQGMIDRYNLSGRGKIEMRFVDDVQANLMLLNKEADLVVGSSTERMFDWAKAGALRPITGLMDVSGIYPHLVECASRDGECWFLPSVFELQGIVVNRSAAEPGTVFKSAAELEAALEKLPQQHFYKTICRSQVLSVINGDEWIDPVTNTAHFDDPSFLAMLEFLYRFAPDQATADANVVSNPALMDFFSFYFPMCEWTATENLGWRYSDYVQVCPDSGVSPMATVMPMPGNGRYRGLAVSSLDFLAVTAKSDKDEMIRDFLSFLFLEGEWKAYNELLPYSDRLYYCPNRKECEAMLESEISRERYNQESGNPVSADDIVKWREDLRDLIQNADHYIVRTGQNEIWRVIQEETTRYFKGEITAEKAAEYVQNRISIYLAEQG